MGAISKGEPWACTKARAPVSATRPSPYEQAGRSLFASVGAFLFEHGLEPTPGNYLLGYGVVTRTNPAAIAAVEDARIDGVRLTQRDADRIVQDISPPGAAAGASSQAADALMQQARQHLEMVENLVGNTHAHAERYGSELQTSIVELESLPATHALEELLKVTSRMIDRTQAAERQLQRTTDEIGVLRRELASASEAAMTDALTGLPNRRALEEAYLELQQRSTLFSAAMCDIDWFKAINDRHGHLIGDRVIRAVAYLLEKSCSAVIAARYGGEEFVLLFEGMGAAATAELMDGARREVAARRFKVEETGREIGTVTISVGVAEAGQNESWLDLLKRTDALLYRAKSAGRNRVEADSPASTDGNG